MVSGRVLFMRVIPEGRKYRGLYCGLGGGIQESQEGADAPGPGGFVVLGAFDALVGKVFAELPAFLQKDVAILLDLLNDARAFLRADVEPDARARLDIRGSGHTVEDALIPPHRRRESGDAAEDSRTHDDAIERRHA